MTPWLEKSETNEKLRFFSSTSTFEKKKFGPPNKDLNIYLKNKSFGDPVPNTLKNNS
jgi:hypothetical protein